MSWADPSGGSWATLNLSASGAFVQDTLVLVNDGTPGANATFGNLLSEEGCNPSPANAYAGKICVIRRNTCEFGTKAKFAQNAGAVAVIVVNRDNSVIAMGGGAQGPGVTIPVIMLTSIEGNAIIAAMEGGPVVAFIGNKTGYYPNDIGFRNGDVTMSKYSAVNKMTSQSASEYSFKVKGKVRNFGTASQSNVVVTAKVTKNGSTLYTQSSAPVTLNSGDSSSFSLADFSLANYPTGRYLLTYSTTMTNTDSYLGDNQSSYEFIVSDTLFSYAPLDTVKFSPRTGGGTRPGTAYSTYSSCIAYQDANASRVGLSGLFFNFATNASDSIAFSGLEFLLSAYLWDDQFTNTLDSVNITFNNVLNNEIASASYYYPGNAAPTSSVYGKFNNNIVLENNKRYLFCVSPAVSKVFMGYSSLYDYNVVKNEYLQPICPLLVVNTAGSGSWNLNGFGVDNIPALAARFFPAAQLGTTEISADNNVIAYPNPANDNVTLEIKEKGFYSLVVTDLTGKVVLKNNSMDLVSGKATVNIAPLEVGMYIFNVTDENGQKSTFNVVKK